MALDRQSIEKRDFPVGRRGYDPDAVDAHLAAVADEVSELRRTSRPRGDTLASSASDQVRSIVQAAETSAAGILAEAQQDAREIRDEAGAEARATRAQATDQARSFVGGVSDSADAMLARLNSMQTELDALIGALRAGAGRLSSELQSLQGDLAGVQGIVAGQPADDERSRYAEHGEGGAATGEPAPDGSEAVEYVPGAPVPFAEEEVLAEEYAYAEDPQVAGADGELAPETDLEGARLIALNMALDGTPREETAAYLLQNFALVDSGEMLDEVYASVEG